MKAILVIDEMPTDCEDCPFGYDYRCFNTWKRFEEKEENRRITYPIPKWCPLKPMPQKKKEDLDIPTFSSSFDRGWNDCLEEIENESN